MFITVPADKRLKIVADTTGPVDLWLEGDPDAPKEGEFSTYTFVRDFLRRVILNDASFGIDMSSVYAGQEIRGLFVGKLPGDVVELTKDQHDRLLAALKRPSKPYSPLVMGALVDFARAIERADEKRPVPSDKQA